MQTQFITKRVEKPGVNFQKLKTRVQVCCNTFTFSGKKTNSASSGTQSLDFSADTNSMYIPLTQV